MMNMANILEMDIEGPYPDVFRWHQAMSRRPSTQQRSDNAAYHP